MAKRSRRKKKGEDVRPADHRSSNEVNQGDTGWTIDAPAFAAFDAQMDGELESLVARWIHCAAPGSTSVRRMVRQSATAGGQV